MLSLKSFYRIGWAEGKTSFKGFMLKEDAPKAETAQIHVSFISKQVDVLISEATIRALFSLYGKVVDVALKKSQFDRNLRIQNGYGFVHYAMNQEGVQAAVNAVNSLHQVTIDKVTYDCSISHALKQYLMIHPITPTITIPVTLNNVTTLSSPYMASNQVPNSYFPPENKHYQSRMPNDYYMQDSRDRVRNVLPDMLSPSYPPRESMLNPRPSVNPYSNSDFHYSNQNMNLPYSMNPPNSMFPRGAVPSHTMNRNQFHSDYEVEQDHFFPNQDMIMSMRSSKFPLPQSKRMSYNSDNISQLTDDFGRVSVGNYENYPLTRTHSLSSGASDSLSGLLPPTPPANVIGASPSMSNNHGTFVQNYPNNQPPLPSSLLNSQSGDDFFLGRSNSTSGTTNDSLNQSLSKEDPLNFYTSEKFVH